MALPDQRSHMLAGLGAPPGDLVSLRLTDLIQGAPQRRIRRDRAEQLGLVTPGGQI